jgi:hypothetical protein
VTKRERAMARERVRASMLGIKRDLAKGRKRAHPRDALQQRGKKKKKTMVKEGERCTPKMCCNIEIKRAMARERRFGRREKEMHPQDVLQ